MCGNAREYPHNIPQNHRRFKNGAWQRPTAKRRGWEPSEGLADMTYVEGVTRINEINQQRRGYTLIDVTALDQMAPTQTKVASTAGGLPTNPMHRRFNTVLNIWEKPTRDLSGWQPSGIADFSLEAGNRYFEDNRHGYINIGAVTPIVPPAGDVPVDDFHRRFNSALGIWEKPTADLSGWKPSVGLANLNYAEGLRYLEENFSEGRFTVSIIPGNEPQSFEPDTEVPVADVDEPDAEVSWLLTVQVRRVPFGA